MQVAGKRPSERLDIRHGIALKRRQDLLLKSCEPLFWA
jgi:hypothetical protein